MSGLDDGLLERRMQESGMETVAHVRLSDARYRWITALYRRLGQATHFSFIFRRPQ